MNGKQTALLSLAIILGTGMLAGTIFLSNSGYKAPLITNSAVPQTNVPQSTSSAAPVGTPTSWVGKTASVAVTNNDRDVLAGTTITENTNVQSIYWWSTDKVAFYFLGAGTTTATGSVLNLTPQMNGIFYIVMQPVSGQNYYIAPLSTQNANACISGYDFMDIQGTGTKQWVFQCDMSRSGVAPNSATNAGGAAGSAPLMTLYTNAYAYTAPTANSDTTSIASIGLVTTDKQNAVYYTLTGTSQKAFALTELDMQVNSTNSTRFNPSLSYWQFPTQQTNGAITFTQLYFSSANQAYNDGTNTYWKYTFTSPLDTTFGVQGTQTVQNLKGAYYYIVPQTSPSGKIPFTANIVTDYQGSTTHLGWKMTAYYIQPSGAIGSVTKTVAICSDASC